MTINNRSKIVLHAKVKYKMKYFHLMFVSEKMEFKLFLVIQLITK